MVNTVLGPARLTEAQIACVKRLAERAQPAPVAAIRAEYERRNIQRLYR